MFNEPISPPSSTPSSPPYYTISSDSEPSDPQSPTLAQFQAHALSIHHQPEPEATIPLPSEQPTTPPSETPSENPIIPNSEPPTKTTHTPPASPSPTPKPEPTFPTLEEAITLFVESLVEKIRSLSENSGISDDPSAVRIHWNKVIRWMTSEAFKLKCLSEQDRNDFIKEAGERLEARLVREAEEKARMEEEQRAREAAEKVVVELLLLLKLKQKLKLMLKKQHT
ncbi:uncharacterized protein LOC127136425 [Lathyrus oleraceus]|uniref:uncharacterized protein LOC127136425 n=1 Tax=Pisum sativum TaxID=3888 RepID=UPI0021CEB551|nr:uncharacterized protein LOC127136425 [Pisum sativum]